MQPPVPIIADGKEFMLRWDETAKDNLEKIKEVYPELAKNLSREMISKMRSFLQQTSGRWSINQDKLSNDQKSILNDNLQLHAQRNKKSCEKHKDIIRQRKKKYSEEHKDRIRQYHEKYREKHKDEIAQRNKKHYKEHKDIIGQYQEKYYEENKDIIRQRKKRYREKNIDKIRQRNKKYREENIDKIRQYNEEYREKNKLLTNSIRKYKSIIVSICHEYIKTQEMQHSIETPDGGRKTDGSPSSQQQVQEAQERLVHLEHMYHELWDLDHTLHVLSHEKIQRKAHPLDQREQPALPDGQPSQERGEGSHAPGEQTAHWAGIGSAEGLPSPETVGLQPDRPPLPDNWQDFLQSVQTSSIGAKMLKSVEKQLIALKQTERGAEPMAAESLLPPEQNFPTNQEHEIRDEWADPHASTGESDQHIWDDPRINGWLHTWENDHTSSSIQDEIHNDPILCEMLYVLLDEDGSNSGSKARFSTETASDIEEVDAWLNLEP
jgi:hypothetical protein